MPAEPIKVGPFISGLNTYSDKSTLPDSAVIDALNFEPDIDGSFKSRPPAAAIGTAISLASNASMRILGMFKAPLGVEYILATNGINATYYFDGTAWVSIGAFVATGMAQFDGKAWLLTAEGDTNPSGSWTFAGGFSSETNMPHGDVIISFKSRLWVVKGKNATANSTRIYYSNVLGVAPFWPVSTFFLDVGQGDGQAIVTITPYYDSILIFRTASIYRFTMTSDPAQGDNRLTVPNVGIENKDCLGAYEGVFYFLYRDRAYRFINSRTEPINSAVAFKEDTHTDIVFPFSVSVFNNRVMYQWWDTTYVYNLITSTWTNWKSSRWGTLGKFWERTVPGDDVPEVVGFPATGFTQKTPRQAALLSMRDEFTSRTEPMLCAVHTKNYDYESATLFKRLFWWNVSAAWNGPMRAAASAINFTKKPTWGQIRAQHTFGSLRLQTWGSLSSDVSTNSTTRDSAGGPAPQRKEGKVGRSIRFKRVNYRVEFDVDGSSVTSPVRLFYLTTFVRAGQTVVKDVS